MLSRSAVFITFLLYCLCLACNSSSMSNECREFFSLPASQREKLFITYSLDDQLSIYRCGMNRRPPDTYLANYIADRGEAAIPVLLTKLEIDKDELTQLAIVNIFEMMSVKGHLRNRADVISRIRQVVTRMQVSVLRGRAEESLTRIEQDDK